MTNPQTAADRRSFLEDGLQAVGCLRCEADVLVRKNSVAHTSVQWRPFAQGRCQAFEPRTGCPELRRSIDDAVAAGRLHVRGG